MKRRTGSFGSFGSLRSKFVELFSGLPYEDEWLELDCEFRAIDKIRLARRDLFIETTKNEMDLKVQLKTYSDRMSELEDRLHKDKDLPMHIKVELKDLFHERWKQVREVERYLPQKQSALLKVILGPINVTLPKIPDRVRYKSSYEDFKLKMNVIGLVFSAVNLMFNMHRIGEAIFQAGTVWYYSTVTLREHILIANGSRIRMWWMLHHYLSICALSLIATWPDGTDYQLFASKFFMFTFYVGFVSCMQFQYQTQRLYRLRALGKADVMDITAEGMRLKGSLSLLIPFLLVGQIYQIFLAYDLLSLCSEGAPDWQVPWIGVCFLFLGLGNIYATLTTCLIKFFYNNNTNRNTSAK